MLIEIQVWKGSERIFGYAFTVRDKSEVPEYFRKAIAAFYEQAPNISLLDPEVSIKLDAPLSKDTSVYVSDA
jgi:hypothetical protein